MARRFDADDRRKSVLDLTKKGSQLLARAPEPYQKRLIEVLGSLPSADLGVLQGALGRLADALGPDDGAPLFFEDGQRSGKAHG
jgi:DNA-binding MarR family transcriptional regulator